FVCRSKLLYDDKFYRFFSNLPILLLLFFCLEISFKTAVNSICLGTYSSLFYSLFVCLKAGAKVEISF
ncbi:hypothetical protein, partial [Flavobacterium erciyesense]|uniref:hypothetical protein n=1 Tax=Flavobacterium erciyesense TaxID=2825842 RepID=UPI001B3802FD